MWHMHTCGIILCTLVKVALERHKIVLHIVALFRSVSKSRPCRNAIRIIIYLELTVWVPSGRSLSISSLFPTWSASHKPSMCLSPWCHAEYPPCIIVGTSWNMSRAQLTENTFTDLYVETIRCAVNMISVNSTCVDSWEWGTTGLVTCLTFPAPPTNCANYWRVCT